MWSRLSVTSAALLLGASAAQAQITAVDFGGDYNDGPTNADKTSLAYENGDFDGEADTDDRRAYIEIDSLFASIPDTNGVGNTTVFNAGAQATQMDSTAGTPGVSIYRFNGSNTAVDYLQVGNSATIGNGATINDDYPQSLTFAPNVAKANFLNGADDTGYTLAFDAAAGSVTAEFNDTSGVFTVRALVKNGSSWYISDTSQIGDGTLSLNGATDTWYPYAPDTNMYINAGTLTGGVLGSTLTDIQALGLVGQVDAAAGQDANKPRIQVTALSASMVQTAVVLAVEFGGDYNNTNTAGSWSPALVYENGDFDGEADLDDRRGYNPMDATILGYNDDTPLGTNLKFNVGNQVTYFDKTDADPLRGFFRWAGSGTTADSYQVGSGATNDGVGQIFTFVPNLSKADFLNGYDDPSYALSFSDADSIVIDTVKQTGEVQTVHAIVQNGSDWYISATSKVSTGVLAINGFTETWHPYYPDTNMLIPALTGGVLGSTLTDIQAVGMVGQVTEPAGQSGSIFRFQGLTVRMDQTLIPLTYGGVFTDTTNTLALWHMDALNASGKVDDDDSVVTGRNATLGVSAGTILVDPAVTPGLDYPDPANADYGKCIYLDGVDDRLPIANAALAIDPSALRIEFWAKSDAAVAGQYIFDRWGQILVYSDATGFQVRVYDASAAIQDHYARPAGFDPTDWNHLAIEVIGEDLDIYVNGELVIDSATISGGMSTTTAKTTTYFGMRYNNTGHFAGYLDEVRISSLTPPAPTLREFDTPVAVVAPTIDGIVSLGEWGDAFELPMAWPDLGVLPNVGSLSGDALEATPSDISAVFSFKWDATNLYILAEVTDDILIKPDAAGSAGYPDDHFLLGLDPDVTDGDIAASVFLTEFGINTNDVAAAYYNGNAIANPALNDFSNHEVEGSIVAGGYVIELALRWADLGVISPVATDMIGVSILLFDNDVDDGNRDILMKSIGDVTIPSEYHQVTLAGAMKTFENYISQYDVGVFDQPTDDPDLDGVDNHTEYALGGDPSVSDAPSFQPTSEANAGGNEFTYIYNRRIGASALGLTYTVEVETDLANADWNTGGVTEDGAVVIDDEFEEVTNTVNMTEDEKFLRLNIN